MARNFEDFYKVIKQIVDEDQETTEEQKAAFIKGVESTKPYIDVIIKKEEELGLTNEEGYILTYLVENRPEEGKPKTAYEEMLVQLVNMMFVHDKKDIVIELYNDEAARLDLVESITGADLEEIKLDRNDDKVAALLKNKEPSLDDLLDIIGFGNLIHIYEKHAPKYRTRAKAQEAGAITEAPNSLAIPTLSKYQYSMSLYQDGGAYLQPLRSTDGLRFKGGKLYFDDARMREVSEVELQNMKTKEGIENIDLMTLRMFYSIILTQFEKDKGTIKNDVITMFVPDLAEIVGLQRNLNKKNIQELISKAQSYHNIVGVLHGTRNGKPTQSLYPVLNFEGYNDKTNTISFSSPYMNMIIRTVYSLATRKDKKGQVKLKKNGTPQLLASHSYLIDPSIKKEKNKAAAENVVLLVQGIETAGGTGYHIAATTLIERNPILSERLERDPLHRAQTLKRTFTKTWELLRTKTSLAEYYKNIELPDPNNPAFIPTVKSLDSLIFDIRHEGKKK